MDYTVILVIINLVFLESLLSIDNAAVLATMVTELPQHQRQKALRYGIVGAYVFRGICLATASFLVQFTALKIMGGLYLLYLGYKGLQGGEDGDTKTLGDGKKSFWGVVIAVELADLAFSIDNIFAAVAMSSKLWVICTGVFIGILAMRFIAGGFVKLIEKHPSLARSAYIVIIVLGVKLIFDGVMSLIKNLPPVLTAIMSSHWYDAAFSLATLLLFSIPLIIKPKATT